MLVTIPIDPDSIAPIDPESITSPAESWVLNPEYAYKTEDHPPASGNLKASSVAITNLGMCSTPRGGDAGMGVYVCCLKAIAMDQAKLLEDIAIVYVCRASWGQNDAGGGVPVSDS